MTNPIKIWKDKARLGSRIKIWYVSDYQMAWIVINGADRSFWSSVYIWFYIWFLITAGVSLILKKKTVFRKCRKTQFLGVGLSRKALVMWNLVKLDLLHKIFSVRHFRLNLAKFLWWYLLNLKKSHENWYKTLVLIKVLYKTTVVNWT